MSRKNLSFEKFINKQNLKKKVDIKESFHYYPMVMRNKNLILTFIFIFYITGCTTKEAKISQVSKHPEQPITIKIIESKKQLQNEKLKQMASNIVKQLPLAIKIGQMIMSYPPKYESVKKYQIGGVILNQNFIKDTFQTKQMCEIYNKQTLIPLFFAIDQEGGKVNRLKHIPGYEKTPSALELGTTFKENELFEYGYQTGITMRKMGLNVNLAPSLDLSSDKNALMFRQARSLGSDPLTVKIKALSLIKGYRAGGILVFAKHYPGYSNVKTNSDVKIAEFDASPIEMTKNFAIFTSLSNYIDGVMTSSIIYNDFDTSPAVFSKKIISLIRIYNPDILVMTDDLYAPALRLLENQNLSMIATKSFIAGNDILLILWDIKIPIIIEAVENTLKENPVLAKQVDKSTERILLAKERIYPGLIEKLYKRWVIKKEKPFPIKNAK